MSNKEYTQIRVTKNVRELLKQLKKYTESTSYSETIRNLGSFDMRIFEKIEDGWEGPYMKKENKELHMTNPGIETVKYKRDKI